MPPVVVNTASAFTIRELSGEGRELTMIERALPYRPFELATTQRMDVTWYAGNPQATATILGASEEPSSINGYWKDKYLGRAVSAVAVTDTVDRTQRYPLTLNGEPVDTVRGAIVILDDFVRQGQILQVTWDEQTRVGHLRQFRKRIHNVHDVEWEMHFEWTSRGEPVSPAVLTEETSISDTSTSLTQQSQELAQAATPSGFGLSRGFLNDAASALRQVRDRVATAADAASSIATLRQTPNDAARKTLAVCTSVATTCEALSTLMYADPPGSFDVVGPISTLTYAQRLRNELYCREVATRSRALRRTAIDRQTTLDRFITAELLASYLARDGDNLRTVSRLFYGTANEWRRLLEFNNLDQPELVQGQQVLIPQISSGGRQ